MEAIRHSDVLRAIGGEPAGPVVGDPVIRAVTTDSRDVPPGALFVPIRGKRYDGHIFVEQAFLKGAAFSLVARDAGFTRIPPNAIVVGDTTKALGDLARWHRSRFDVPVVGITGSCGKTTIKEMLRPVLGERVVVSHASFNNSIGVPLTLLRMNRSTRACVVEIGTSAPGEIAYLSGIARPTVGILSNVEEAHLEGLGSVRGVMREKAALLRAIPESGAAILNADNYYCREIMSTLRGPAVVSFGTWEDADVYGLEARPTRDGFEVLLFGRMPLRVPALGMHNVSNALAAVACGLWLGRSPSQVSMGLSRYKSPAMRMSRESVGSVTLINDAYNANPGSMEAALRELALRECRGRRVAVLGDMLELGDETERFHHRLGMRAAHKAIDLLWAIGPHAEVVASAAIDRGMPADRVRWHESLKEAMADPAFEPEAGDMWLFKASRGMALEHIVDLVRERAREVQSIRAPQGLSRINKPTG